METRSLQFQTIDDAINELDRLHKNGYQAAGNWNLAQTCDHLAFFIDGSLDGHRFKVPWVFKTLFGRMVLKRILGQRKMKPGVFTPQKPLPEPNLDEAEAVARLRKSLERLKTHSGTFYPSPFFGTLTPEQWRDVHTIHCAHHFGYLIPRG